VELGKREGSIRVVGGGGGKRRITQLPSLARNSGRHCRVENSTFRKENLGDYIIGGWIWLSAIGTGEGF